MEFKALVASEDYNLKVGSFTFGLLKHFDLPQISSVVSPRSLWLLNPVDPKGEPLPLTAQHPQNLLLPTYWTLLIIHSLPATSLQRAVAGDQPEQIGRVSVWIVADPSWSSPELPPRSQIVIPPASDNLTLQRQEGLFLYCPRNIETPDDLASKYVEDEPLETVIEKQSPRSVVQVVD